MKQVTFSQSQWDLLNAAVSRVKVHAYNQWSDWRENQVSILSAGMDEDDYEAERNRRFKRYCDLSNLLVFLKTNAREIEEDKA